MFPHDTTIVATWCSGRNSIRPVFTIRKPLALVLSVSGTWTSGFDINLRIINDSRSFHCQVSMLKNTTHTNNVVGQFSSSSSKKQTEQKEDARMFERVHVPPQPQNWAQRATQHQGARAPLVRPEHRLHSCNSDTSQTSFRILASTPISAANAMSTSLVRNATSDAAWRTSTTSGASPNATPCTAAISRWEMDYDAPMAFWKLWRMARVRSARRPESVCCGSPCKSDTVIVVSLNRLFLVVGGAFLER